VLSTVPVGARVISLDRTLNQRSYKVCRERACGCLSHPMLCVCVCVCVDSTLGKCGTPQIPPSFFTHIQLIKTVEDPAGDLQRVSGYVYEKVA
jgi:hypothetical protein